MTHRPALSFSTLLCAVLLACCADELVQPIRTPDAPAASRAADPDADNVWIVRLRDVAAADVPAQARALAHSHGATLRHTFEHFGMFSVKMPAPAAAALLRNPRIVSVTPNQRLIDFSHGTQSSAPWALDRVSQRALPLNGLYTYTETGAGVHVYVVDKGIRATHQEFAGRIAEVANVYGAGGDCSDGHGTRAASFAAGSAYGVARGASIHAIDVADCTFYEEKIVAGLHHVRTSSRPWPSIVTLSSGYYPCALPPPSVPPTEPTEPGGPIIVDFSYSSSANCNAPTPLDSAVMNLIAAGVPVVVAAGNQNADACTVSPARVGTAISVGASNASDQRWFSVETVGSNYGTCV
ncbi:MAG TPA: S8 family serine peptidase, partial [Longimicrobium sp.]|nr:S8 family serine peptidase [Longimicrobium sp.]